MHFVKQKVKVAMSWWACVTYVSPGFTKK